jgi:hypothetical protein
MTTKEQRDELKVLSRDLFGASSRWRKMLERGYLDTPQGDEKFTKKGSEYKGKVRRRYSPETLLVRLQELKAQRTAKKAA